MRVRVHQHVNPLAPYFTFTPEPLDLEKIFARPGKPLFLDIGSARGRFLLQMAAACPDENFLGAEIREPLVEEANRIRDEQDLSNLHYEFINATLALGGWLAKLPAGILRTVAIQFPDPWYKKKHAKRRMVNNNLVETAVNHLADSGKIFIQTDVEFLAEEMFELFRQNRHLREVEIFQNPFPVKTERETAVEEKGLIIYRAFFYKKINKKGGSKTAFEQN